MCHTTFQTTVCISWVEKYRERYVGSDGDGTGWWGGNEIFIKSVGKLLVAALIFKGGSL